MRKLIPFLMILTACGSAPSVETLTTTEKVDSDYEVYPITTVQDIVLNVQNHPTGYRRTDCFTCHTEKKIHQVDRINAGESVLQVARDLVKSDGLTSCINCHGNNGVN